MNIQLKHASTSMLQDDGCSSYHIPRPSCHFYLALTLGDVHWLNNRKTYVGRLDPSTCSLLDNRKVKT
jgi:hypothetical protein